MTSLDRYIESRRSDGSSVIIADREFLRLYIDRAVFRAFKSALTRQQSEAFFIHAMTLAVGFREQAIPYWGDFLFTGCVGAYDNILVHLSDVQPLVGRVPSKRRIV